MISEHIPATSAHQPRLSEIVESVRKRYTDRKRPDPPDLTPWNTGAFPDELTFNKSKFINLDKSSSHLYLRIINQSPCCHAHHIPRKSKHILYYDIPLTQSLPYRHPQDNPILVYSLESIC